MNLNTNAKFSEGQLNLIRNIAIECAEPDATSRISDEWAVFTTISEFCSGFTADELVVLHLAAKACEHLKLGAMTVYEVCAEFARIYRGETLDQIQDLVDNAVRACTPLAPFISPIQLPNGKSITPRIGNPGYMGPFSLN